MLQHVAVVISANNGCSTQLIYVINSNIACGVSSSGIQTQIYFSIFLIFLVPIMKTESYAQNNVLLIIKLTRFCFRAVFLHLPASGSKIELPQGQSTQVFSSYASFAVYFSLLGLLVPILWKPEIWSVIRFLFLSRPWLTHPILVKSEQMCQFYRCWC